ncbi:MAG TPA: hypothetical protein VK550_22470 [Polyangiaceae bacterium]|nr:hypothetical protein [Polyangiaceae bacterium]
MPAPSFLRIRHAVAAVLVFTAACSSKDDDKYADANSYCSGRAAAECSKEVILACAAPNETKCVGKRQAACVAAIPTGTSYNANGAEGCVNAVSSAFADAKISVAENRTVNETCAAVFDGPGAANATCRQDVECKVSAGLRCVLRGGSDTGTCQVPDRVMGGGSCSSPSQSCIAGFHCGATQHCDINAQLGEPCTEALPCIETSRCIAGKCEKKLDDGSPCASDQECVNALCARGTSSAQGRCVSQVTLAPNEPFCLDTQ